jgi:CTP-dependent riboflavin kinase
MYSKKYLGKVEDGGKSSTKWMPQYIPWLFPGTLNIRLKELVPEILWLEERNTHYNDSCRIAKCKINKINAFLINPPEVSPTAPTYLAEIGHQDKLRDILNLKNGDFVSIIFDIK